jgi:hypothetical protein
MADYNWTPGESNNTRDDDVTNSGVTGAFNRTEAVRSMNDQRMCKTMPAMGTPMPSHMGSQSTAPNAPTTPGK